jgi:polyhydroxyalkanoate synthase subunit PhaC
VKSMPIVSKAAAQTLPCRVHALSDGNDHSKVIRTEFPAGPALEAPQAKPMEAYQADRAFHAMLARLTGGISPVALSLAFIDWASHLMAPQRQMEIGQDALHNAGKLFESALHYFSPARGPWSLIKPQPQDRRFAKPEWENPPFNLLAQAFLLNQQWWHNATTAVRGVAPANEAIVEFLAHRADPVLPDDRQSASGADSDRAGLDHEILHPRPVTAKFAGEVPDR